MKKCSKMVFVGTVGGFLMSMGVALMVAAPIVCGEIVRAATGSDGAGAAAAIIGLVTAIGAAIGAGVCIAERMEEGDLIRRVSAWIAS